MESGLFLKLLILLRHPPLIAFELTIALVSHQAEGCVAKGSTSQAA